MQYLLSCLSWSTYWNRFIFLCSQNGHFRLKKSSSHPKWPPKQFFFSRGQTITYMNAFKISSNITSITFSFICHRHTSYPFNTHYNCRNHQSLNINKSVDGKINWTRLFKDIKHTSKKTIVTFWGNLFEFWQGKILTSTSWRKKNERPSKDFVLLLKINFIHLLLSEADFNDVNWGQRKTDMASRNPCCFCGSLINHWFYIDKKKVGWINERSAWR